MKGIWGIALWLLVAVAAHAQTAELRMPVSGEIGIDPDGAVFDYRLDTELTPAVAALVERSVRQWKFEPVLRGAVATRAKARMRLTLIAHQVPSGYQLQVERVQFSGYRASIKMTPPRYPVEAARGGVSGNVLVAVRVNAEGRVVDASAVQTSWPNSKVNEAARRYWGKVLEKASLEAARRWVFESADAALHETGDATLVVPVNFWVGDTTPPDTGWRYESAGPTNPIPWLTPEQQVFDASGLKQGEVLALDLAVKLKTPVVGSLL